MMKEATRRRKIILTLDTLSKRDAAIIRAMENYRRAQLIIPERNEVFRRALEGFLMGGRK